ncbi:hypothetical protein D3C76_493530 [compost metagenome]
MTGVKATSSTSAALLKTAIEKDDVIIGAFKNGKVTKQFLMETDKVYGHKTFLEGTEVGFYIYRDVFTGQWMAKGSGTASIIGGKYVTADDLNKIRQIFGLK